MSRIETARLILRPWREQDADDLYKYASDPRIGPRCGWLPHPNVGHSLDILRKVLIDEHTWAVTEKGGDKPIGSISYFASPCSCPVGEPEIGYWLGVPFWGRGYIPEAVAALIEKIFSEGYRNIWCAHHEGNDRSRRVIEKCGFEYRYTRPWRSEETGEEYTTLYYRLTTPERGPQP